MSESSGRFANWLIRATSTRGVRAAKARADVVDDCALENEDAHDWHARARYDLDALHSGARLGQDRRWTPEVSASVGLGHVFRFDDETFGDRLNAGVAVAIAHRAGQVE